MPRQNFDAAVQLRLSSEMKARLEAMADRAGMPLGMWIRKHFADFLETVDAVRPAAREALQTLPAKPASKLRQILKESKSLSRSEQLRQMREANAN